MRLALTCVAIVSMALASGCDCDGGTDPMDGGDVDGAAPTDGMVPVDAGPDAMTTPDTGPGDAGPPPECAAPADCDAMYGAPPCGAWECNAGSCDVACPGCTDADGDGYGPEPECAGPDCDDADDMLGDNGVRSCYSGPSGTAGVGECLMGTETCIDGALGPCTGSVTPSGEACNDQDDDCDGATDETLGDISCGRGACAATAPACDPGGTLGMCTPGTPAADDSVCDGGDDDCDGLIDEDCATCVTVSGRIGDNAAAMSDGNATPFATIQAAIDWAAADATRPRVVCVASGAGCSATRTYAETITMADGISVLGRFEDSGFNSCGSLSTGRTIIAPAVTEGVMFPSSISMPTALSRFDIQRLTAPGGTTTAVTVDGATNVTLTNLWIVTIPTADRSYGINLINGAAATISDVSIYGGNAAVESVGVRSVGSTPHIIDNCDTLDASGRCDDFCGGGRNVGIRGSFGPTTGQAHGVLLDASPGARIEQSAICGNNADSGSGVRIVGDATGTLIRGNLINAWGGETDSHGVWMTDCGGAAPWILDNVWIAAAGDNDTTRVDGVRAEGACHPVIDSNVQITGGGEGGTSGANGVHCLADPTSGTPSACVVLGNLLIEGSAFGFPPTSVGVRCESGSCLRVADNLIDARGGLETWGLWLDGTGTFVDDNEIRAGCATRRSIGVYAEDAWARLQNNRILGGSCPAGALSAPEVVGLWVDVEATTNELDVHSNTIDAQGSPTLCRGAALVLGAGSAGVTASSGVYRNNIILSGQCGTRYDAAEIDTGVDPRVFENNDLAPNGSPAALYRDENMTNLTDIAMVNGLTDMTVSGNISEDPLFVAPGDYHLTTSSMCADAGTTAGAPALDMDDAARDSTPDIGADEI